ncbi:unnamed protein product [Boreogadus saida]
MRRHAPIFLTTRGAVEFNSCQGDDINSELSSTPQGSVRAQHGHNPQTAIFEVVISHRGARSGPCIVVFRCAMAPVPRSRCGSPS